NQGPRQARAGVPVPACFDPAAQPRSRAPAFHDAGTHHREQGRELDERAQPRGVLRAQPAAG
ncbi:MAG: hypothetical protein BJ554DRAFT_1404, partial [Olpidium bornovanus]